MSICSRISSIPVQSNFEGKFAKIFVHRQIFFHILLPKYKIGQRLTHFQFFSLNLYHIILHKTGSSGPIP